MPRRSSEDETEGSAPLSSRTPRGASMTRDSDQLEALVAGVAELAWNLPDEVDAFRVFEHLVNQCGEEEFNFSRTYLANGSRLREQACNAYVRVCLPLRVVQRMTRHVTPLQQVHHRPYSILHACRVTLMAAAWVGM